MHFFQTEGGGGHPESPYLFCKLQFIYFPYCFLLSLQRVLDFRAVSKMLDVRLFVLSSRTCLSKNFKVLHGFNVVSCNLLKYLKPILNFKLLTAILLYYDSYIFILNSHETIQGLETDNLMTK